jgi:pimeloyl-ACP methyl ester carboxylesterase
VTFLKSIKEFRLQEGTAQKPVVVLIHGFGMNGHFWEQPESCLVLGGLASLTLFLADHPPIGEKKGLAAGRTSEKMEGLGLRLINDGFSTVSWSQSEPLGPISLAVDELATVMDIVHQRFDGRPIWLLAHSRGGLVARSFLQENNSKDITGLITLGTPHDGTELALLARYLQPVGAFFRNLLPSAGGRGKVLKAMRRVADFLSSDAIAELKPDAALIQSLQRPLPSTMALFSFGGTDPGLFSLYRRNGESWRKLTFPDFLLRLIPDQKIPPELMSGKGDGLVSSASARLPGGEHANFEVNHVRLAFEPTIYRKISGILGG